MNKLMLIATSLSLLVSAGAASAQPRHDGDHNRAPHKIERSEKQTPRGHHWRSGQRLETRYRGNAIRDYKRYHLRAPARGQHWVKVDNDYLLISAATGLIASIVAAR